MDRQLIKILTLFIATTLTIKCDDQIKNNSIVNVFMPINSPKISILSHTLNGDTIDIPADKLIHLRCTGQHPMIWIFPNNNYPLFEHNEQFNNIKVRSDCDRQVKQSARKCWTEVIIPEAKYDMTGSYVCLYNQSNIRSSSMINYHPISIESTDQVMSSSSIVGSVESSNVMDSIYIYVNDPHNLMVPFEGQVGFLFIALFQQQPATIPCRPTYSKAVVKLWKTNSKENGSPEEIKPNSTLGITYDSKKGFYFENARWDTESNSLQCHFEIDGLSSTASISIHWSILPSDLHPIIDDTRARHVFENQTFSLRCFVHIEIGVIIVVDWVYPKHLDKERRVTKSHIETTSSNVDGNSYHTVSLNMTVTNATIDDQGDYRCNVTDGNGRIFSMVKRINILDKHLPPTINFTTDFNTSIPLLHDKDEDVRFMVVVNAFPDISLFNLTWYKDDERLDLNTPHYQIETFSDVSTQISFYIPKSRSFDSGIYTLVGNYSTASANISFTVLISGEPELILENVLDFYVVNQSYELICKSFAFPKGLVWWSWFPCNSPSSCFNELMEQKQNLLHHKIQDDWINISSIMDESVLNVSNQAVMLNDLNQGKPYLNMSKLQIGTALHLGIYRCSSLNIYKGVQHRQTPFLVMDSDELFSVTSSTDEPTINDTIVLTCKASLIQFEDIDWIITSPEHLKLIRPKTTNLYSVTSTVLLTSVQLNDSGTFTCMAKRRGSSQYDQKDVVLIVKNVSSPMIMDTNMENKLIEKDFSSQFELRCYVSGRPTPNVVWYRNGRQFFTKHDLGIRSEERGQRLVFTRLLDRDSGHYECRANNRGGSVVRKAFLRVKGNDSYETIQLGEILFTIFLVLIGMMMLFMALSVGKKIRDEKLNKRELEFFSQKIFEHGQMEMFNPEMPLDEQIDLLPYDSRFEFPKERLELGHTLGQGAFGRVVKAKAIGLENDESTTTVAVKMLKERADANQRKALMAELKILIHLGRHLNIVNLLGAVTKNIAKGELLVIVEFCEFGNLRHFLYTNRDSFINELEQPPPLYGDYQNFEFIQSQLNHRRSTEPSTPSTPNTPNENNINTNGGQGSPLAYFNHNYVSGNSSFTSSFTFKRPRSNATRVSTSDLKCFAFQCARGMEYLTSRKLIHRDLAARNVLLATNNVVKICDFGLAKDVYKYDNYVKKDDGPLPIKWMAIESISDKIFTSKSDVWSFGILLWEIFTLGKNPYPGVEIDERFFKRLKAGYRMEKPEYSSDEIYGLMCQCWAANPNERPDFGEIVSIIGDLMDDKIRQHYIDLNNPYLERNHQIFNQTDEYLKMNSMCSGYAEGYLRMDSERADDEDGSDIMLEEQNNNSANKLVRQAQNEPNVILVDGKTKIEMINMQNLSFQQDTSRHIPSETATTFRTSSLEVLSYDNLNQMIPNGTLNGQIHHHHHHNHHHHPIGHLQQTIPK